MPSLTTTNTNSADDSEGRVFGLTGQNYLFPVIALVVSVGLFALCFLGLNLDIGMSLLFSCPVVGVCVAYTLLLKEGKPKGYAEDFLDNICFGSNWGPKIQHLQQYQHPTHPQYPKHLQKTQYPQQPQYLQSTQYPKPTKPTKHPKQQ